MSDSEDHKTIEDGEVDKKEELALEPSDEQADNGSGDEQEEDTYEDDGPLELEGELDPLFAMPPRILRQEENQVEVSASPAFQSLDELFQQGKLSGTQVALLKASYTKLHDYLKCTRENEMKLLEQVKSYLRQRESQKNELEQADHFPGNSDSEVSKLRQTMLQYSNELAQSDERLYQLNYKLECCQEDKKMIQREYDRMPKAVEMEKRIEDLKKECAEIRREITQRQQECRAIREDLENKDRNNAIDEKEVQELIEEMEKKKSDLVAIQSLPAHYAKESDKSQRLKNELDKNLSELDAELKQRIVEIRTFQKNQDRLNQEKTEQERIFDRHAARLAEKESEFQLLMKDYEYAKEREAVLLGDKATLDLNIRHLMLEKKNAHDLHGRIVRDKDRELKQLKKGEQQMRNAQDNMALIKMMLDKAQGQLYSFPKDDGSMKKKKDDLNHEVETTKRALAQQNSLTAVEQVKVEQSIAEEERLLYEQSDLRIEVVELTRLAAIKNDEREQKARDFMRAEMRHHRALQDLKTKELQIHDHQKKLNEFNVKLRDFADLYNVIKNERNKYVNQIQSSMQKAAEMREKIKIMQNEMEILRTAVAQKERLLQKQRLKHMNAVVVRDSLRNEIAKQNRIDEEMREKKDQQKMDISKLSMLINQAEQETTRLRKRYETAVQHRNDRGVQLIEREEEVCVFYERFNIQEEKIRNGEIQLNAREEEIHFFKMEVKELERKREILRQRLPKKKALDEEIVTLQIQRSQCQDRMLELERVLEDPDNPERVRLLGGTDAIPAMLHSKLEDLEMRLARKEEGLLEKEMILEQVARLSDRLRKKAESGGQDSLLLAKQVNKTKAEIKGVTREMMALVAELSMKQAETLQLQQKFQVLDEERDQCYKRMEKNEPPSEEIEREWLRNLRDDMRRDRDKEMLRLNEQEEEQYTLAGGIVTTAVPRPNAYIPENEDELPVPRPYGKHAPFKPSEAGTNMRHIRKPVPKPIEI